MDSSSWIHGYAANSNGSGGNSGFMCGYAARTSCIPSVLQCREEQEHELLLSSQIQQHLNQISLHLNIDEVEPGAYSGAVPSGDIGSFVDDFDFFSSQHAAGGCSFLSSSSTSSFRSASLSCSPEISSTATHVLAAPATGLPFLGFSSLAAPGVVLPYDDKYAVSFIDTPAAMAPGGMSTSTSAFRRYERHLGSRRRPKPVCGQRMFKTAISVLARMHTAMRYNHEQQRQQFYCQQQQVSAAEPSANQHMISERKRRGKLKDSFHALRTVLPPGSKKLDKTSILIVAREYVSSLKSKVCELEEKNQTLESQLARPEENSAGEKVEIQMTRTRAAAAEDHQTGEVYTVKIATPAQGNTTDVVLRTLQCLKDQIGEDVSLVAMSTGNEPHRASLTLHLKSASGAKWEEEAVTEAVTKAVAIGRDN